MDVKVKKRFIKYKLTNSLLVLSVQTKPIVSALEARSVRSDPAEENWRLRQNLALSYRVINDLSLNEGSCNHLSVMAPQANGSGEEVMLIGERSKITNILPVVAKYEGLNDPVHIEKVSHRCVGGHKCVTK